MIKIAYNYGIIGNCSTTALVSSSASIDWCCFPKFDSPSVFAKLLDDANGGSLDINPVGRYHLSQKYLKHTNILKTIFKNKRNAFEVLDFFVRYQKDKQLIKGNKIHRLIRVIKGKPLAKISYNPKLNYAKGRTSIHLEKDKIIAANKSNNLTLYSNLKLSDIFNKKQILLPKTSYVIIDYNAAYEKHNLKHVLYELKQTKSYWLDFVNKGTWPRLQKEMAIRSALALKLMTYDDTGAIIAAPTTSLPEVIGQSRNWDYRYCWLRDSSFTINALTKICHHDEAENYMNYLKRTLIGKNKLQIMYDLTGKSKLTERKLTHLRGFKSSKPVRIGNAAYTQNQLDSVGELIYTIHEFYCHYFYGRNLDQKMWILVKNLLRHVEKKWLNTDHGIWEFRKIKKQFTFSKLMSWVAFNKALEIADFFKKPYPTKWLSIREKIKNNLLAHAYNQKKGCFTIFYGSQYLDATSLLMIYYEFIDSGDPRMMNTIKVIEKELGPGPLIRRYNLKDDIGYQKNAFLICSFWLIEALYLSGQRIKAKKYFKQMTQYCNHLGLYSEGFNPKKQEQTGNFPQAYTHIAFINTAVLLSGKGVKRPVCLIKH